MGFRCVGRRDIAMAQGWGRNLGLFALGLAAGLAFVVPGCASFRHHHAKSHGVATADLEAKSGSHLTGKAVFRDIGNGWVHFRVEVAGVSPGRHAVHIHEFGDCSSPDGKSTGGHWNPYGNKHGQWDEMDGQYHLGDIGNIEVGPDGTGSLELTTDKWTIGTGGVNDVVGHSIIVHSGTDDFVTQPTGNAGGRIGAGEIHAGT
jgi:Cu-Zn family superoxide dismutase